MLPKRTGEHLHSRNNTTEESPELTDDEEVINVEDDLEVCSTPGPSSAQATIERLKDYVRAGDQKAISKLLERQQVNLKSLGGADLLWTAYLLDKIQIAAILVLYGANMRVRQSSDNGTILHYMLRRRGIESSATRELFKLMLDQGADVDARDSGGNSLLNCAIASSFRNSTELAEELLKRGARVTIDEEDRQRDDICLACEHKIGLLPKLILHQNPDVETRDRKAIIAVKRLITENYAGAKGSEALLMIKTILDLGVPVDVPPVQDTQRCREKFSFLDTALWAKNRLAIKFLLDYGANPHQLNGHGHTTLYQAMAFKEDNRVSRWLIGEGVSIRARNSRGGYPIHGACINESVKNVHLLLNLGANLRAVDECRVTPFGAMDMKKEENEREAHHLVIQHLALMVARGEKVNRKDLDKINEFDWSKIYFEKCMKQLARMKEQKVDSDVFYFSLLSKNMYTTVQLVKNESFVENFKRDEDRRFDLFPQYFNILMNAFELAEKRLAVLAPESKELQKVFNGSLPDCIVEKIAYYMCFVELKDCRRKYFMSYYD